MEYLQGVYSIESTSRLTKDVYEMIIDCPNVAKLAKYGQFVNILCDGFLLRRPMSISGIDKGAGTIKIVYKVVGGGTEWMAQQKAGDTIDMLAPLGNGFELLEEGKKALIVSAGMGAPPVLGVAQHYGKNAAALVGFNRSEVVILQKDFEDAVGNFMLVTTNGSAGNKGHVTDFLGQMIDEIAPDIIYSCGPRSMLRDISIIAVQKGVRCQVSMEERMACGIGACFGCVCKTRDKNGNVEHKCTCTEGPVFEAEEVEYDG